MTDRAPLWAQRVLARLHFSPQALRHAASLGVLAITAGCATGNNTDVHQFAPMPRVEIGQAELGPVSTRPVSQLLREAERAYEAANAAHGSGNRAEAMKQYKVMLDRLAEAEIDPSVFHSLRAKIDSMSSDGVKPAVIPQGTIGGLNGNGTYNDLVIPFPIPERVLVEIDEIMTVYPKGFQIGLDRAQRYMPYIREEFRKAGLPEELGWICMVESQFNEKIDSHAGAGGMWQFMPATARRYNLRLDSHVDERYNWKSSTQSAIAMLKHHHDLFDGDWALAIAAYNMGEGGLSRAVAANNGQSDFWRLIETPPASDRIRRETKKYYPRFLASVIVANNPRRYGFHVNPAAPDNTVRVPVPAMYALSDLDNSLGVPRGTLAKFNPDLIAEVTPPSGDYGVNVPVDLRHQLVAALNATPPMNSVQYASVKKSAPSAPSSVTHAKHHRVKRGDTLARIAALHGVTVEDLKRENNLRSSHIRVNQTVKIPGRGVAPQQTVVLAEAPTNTQNRSGRDAAAISESLPAVPAAPSGNTMEYTVAKGDTLNAIAQRFGVTVADLQRWNNMQGKTNIAVNQKLTLTAGKGGAAPAAPQSPLGVHVVASGEYPAKIARAYNMTLSDFLALNEFNENTTIREDQEVRVRGAGNGGTSTPKSPEPKVYTVERGDTATAIANKHGISVAELMAWNGLTSKSVLRPGQQCKIFPSGSAVPKGGADSNAPVQLAADRSAKTHVVSQGHNPTSIARRYGVSVSDLFAWNSWSKNHVLKVGDKVLIYD